MESQLFIMELARELNKICQVSFPPLSVVSVPDKTSTAELICAVLYPRGQTSLATSGPVRTSGRPVSVGISSWNGLLCWRRKYRYVHSAIAAVSVINDCISYMHLLQLQIIFCHFILFFLKTDL